MIPALRTHWRLVRVGLHLGYGLAVAAVVYPLAGRPAQLKLKQRWSRQLLGMLGVRLQAKATPLPSATLLVANHISWLDIYVINALAPAAFICKADVRSWPFIGWLCERTETVFMPRGSRNAAKQAGEIVALRLRQGWRVAVFPEGTTSDGGEVLPFHGALLQGAMDASCRVQPLALRYLDGDGRLSTAPAYCGDTTLLQSLRRIAAAPRLHVRLDVLPPLDGHGAERRALAATAWRAIRHSLNRDDAGGTSLEEEPQDFSLAAT
ncbi:MAG: 1-acyl-sn-glycerol-3-phosphate acyltransferase [Rhodocyclales bacterium]|nr:1-acyl-sn-glycerol-3-phosphate acyltransferase [Rhodocyclales bacterium]